MTAIHAAWSPGEIRIAAVEDGGVADFALWRPGAPDGVGDIWRGLVTALVPAMAGAFVVLGREEGYLPDSEGAKGLTAGTILTVRVTRASMGGKGPRLSARNVTVEEGPPGLRRRGADPLREMAARYPAAPVVVDDPALAAALRADLGPRLMRVARAFDDAIETEIDNLTGPDVTLPSGIRIAVHPTPALAAIDVDAGRALAGGGAAARRHEAVNAAAIPELARQIRLRNLSGGIVVDFAGLKAKRRASLGPALSAALAGDPLRPRFLGFTALGFAEIARPRIRPPLHEMLAGPLAAGLAALRAIAAIVVSDPGRRTGLRAAPAVVAALQADPVALADLARIAGAALKLHADPSLAGNIWSIED